MKPDALAAFANPWEHARLLSDPERNRAMVACLEAYAPGRRVLEIGAGTGVLSCIAARLGATRVLAVEPTPLVHVARELVRRNGLEGVVEVLEGRVEDLAPQPVDLAISELLNADPFYEGVVEASHAAMAWLAPGGRLAPRRLRVWVALLAEGESAREVRLAQAELARLGGAYDLDLNGVSELILSRESYGYAAHIQAVTSTAALVCDIQLGAPAAPPERVEVAVEVLDPGPVGAATVWFEAELGDGIRLDNRPGRGGHWGQLVCAFAEERGTRAGERVRLALSVEDGALDIRRLEGADADR